MTLRSTALPAALCALSFALSTDAGAVIYLGNPTLNVRVDRPLGDYVEGTVDFDKVRVHHCAGGYTDYTVAKTIDPVAGYDVDIDAGNHCGVTFFWDSVMDIDGPAYTVRYSGSTTAVTLDTPIDPVALTPYTVISGSMSGGGPQLVVTID